MSAVFKSKLRLHFILPSTVIAKKGLAYAPNLPLSCAYTHCFTLHCVCHIVILLS